MNFCILVAPYYHELDKTTEGHFETILVPHYNEAKHMDGRKNKCTSIWSKYLFKELPCSN
jgi:hypothetical protein